MSRDAVIAVIDDDGLFRAALLELLSSLDYEAYGFASAEAFLGFDGARSLDCIITDIHMPGMSGVDLIQKLRFEDYRASVILITARAEPGLEARVAAMGAVCLLRKPFEAGALIRCLERATSGGQGS
ncbi:response regulator transcription factor [Sphingomonas quercus]|uniref:Response regulator n=1 Tax=Sphingomonas quercus TaxID=2842451 RepID=A0ABS6BNK6_9SPHN|nr:response regulator [Sphingomonas quercus]